MVLRWSVAALCCGLLVVGGAEQKVRAADNKPAAEKKAAEESGKGDAKKGDAEKEAKADGGKNGTGKDGNGKDGKNGKNGSGHHAATVQTRPTARGEQGHVKVLVPVADAKVWVDDMLTRAKGLERSFLSPVRDRDRTYSYHLRVEWTDQEGHTVKKKVRATFHGQEDVIVDFR